MVLGGVAMDQWPRWRPHSCLHDMRVVWAVTYAAQSDISSTCCNTARPRDQKHEEQCKSRTSVRTPDRTTMKPRFIPCLDARVVCAPIRHTRGKQTQTEWQAKTRGGSGWPCSCAAADGPRAALSQPVRFYCTWPLCASVVVVGRGTSPDSPDHPPRLCLHMPGLSLRDTVLSEEIHCMHEHQP